MGLWPKSLDKKKTSALCTDTVLTAYRDWYAFGYLNMVAKLGYVDSKGISSVSEMTWLNSGALGYHLDSVPGETWSNHCVEHNFNDRLSHSEETPEPRRARQRDSAPGEETPEHRGAILIDSAVTQGQTGTVPDSGTCLLYTSPSPRD